MKNQLQSKTIWVSIIIGLASVLALFGVIDTKSIDLSPDAAWVGIAWSLIQYILRLVTKEPVKQTPVNKASIIVIMFLALTGCAATATTDTEDTFIIDIGTEKLTEIVNLYYKSGEGVIKYLETKENALPIAIDLFYDVMRTVKDFSYAELEVKNLTDQEIIDLVSLSKNFDLGEYKKYFESACKFALFGIQERYKYYKSMEGKSESVGWLNYDGLWLMKEKSL